MNPVPLLELSAGSIAHPDGSAPLIQGIDWRVMSGEWWVVAGSQGTGKSILLQSLAGLVPWAAGELTVLGVKIPEQGRRAAGWRRQLGLVFEGGGRLLRDLTVAENIALPVGYHGNCSLASALEGVLPWLEALGLERLAEVPAGRIGRAWAQRAAVARALATGPDLLLLDNPLAGMDQYHLRWWREFLPRLATGHPVREHRPLTLVVATDTLRPWLSMAGNFALIEERRWRILGDRKQLEAERGSRLAEWLQTD